MFSKVATLFYNLANNVSGSNFSMSSSTLVIFGFYFYLFQF